MRTMLVGMVLAAGVCAGAWAQDLVAGRPYVKQATREETREKFLASLGNATVSFGRWMVVGPFEHPAGGRDIATPYAPEELLPALSGDEPEPLGPADRRREFEVGGGKRAAWREAQEVGGADGKRVEIDQALGVPGKQRAVAYLYRRVDAPRDMAVEVKVGSDDGCRVWLNGKLVVDTNAERSFSPDSERPTLRLRKGHNHLLVKVSQGAGEWRFGLNADPDVDPVVEAALEWRLEGDFPTGQGRCYRIATIPHPADLSLEVGGIDIQYPKGGQPRPVVCTRRGDVYVVEGAFESPPTGAKFIPYAAGLQEPLGLVSIEPTNGPSAIPSGVYIAQRSELTRLEGVSPDGVPAVSFRTVCDRWKISGNYHEYAFGPKVGPGGKLYVNLNLAHSDVDGTVMGALVPGRGTCVAVDPVTGAMETYADGMRSPDGLVVYEGELFYTDNQGDYVATNKLSWVRPGSFHGHQSSLKFRDGYGKDWKKNGKPVPEITWPAVWFPYQKMGQSASDGVEVMTEKFGPFKGQVLVGDQTHCTVNRVFLEKVKDEKGRDWYQGACFPFLSGFASGVHRLCWGPDGSLLVGMTDRGWGSTGPKRDGLQRVVWTGVTPFEVRAMRVTAAGFELEFTGEVDAAAADPSRYAMKSYTYEYHPAYGSAEMDTRPVKVAGVRAVSPTRVELVCEGVRGGGVGYVHELRIDGVKSKAGEPLMHDMAYYTVQVIPTGAK